MSRIETLADGVTLHLGNCQKILPTLGRLDAIVTDPPYGISADEAAAKNKGKWGWKDHGATGWDRERPPPSLIMMLREISAYQIIWGGNYFTDILPPTMQWLIWDKGQREFSLADCEMAWSSQKAASRLFNFSRGKAVLDGKEHPTQKPIEVMKWCLEFIPDSCATIVDPFMGSGTTGIASVKTGRKFIGIEKEPKYFDIACRRIQDALDRPDMFIDKPKPPKQEALSLDGSGGQ